MSTRHVEREAVEEWNYVVGAAENPANFRFLFDEKHFFLIVR